MLKKPFTYIFFILVIICYTSCKDASNHSDRSKPVQFIDTFEIWIDFIPDKIQITTGLTLSNDSLSVLRSGLKDDEWYKISRYFAQFLDAKNEIWTIILYVDNVIKGGDTMKFNDVLGFQVYFIKPGNILYHKLFLSNNEDKVYEYESLTCEVKGIDCESISFIENNLFEFHKTSKFTYTQMYFYHEKIKNFVPNHDSKHEIVYRLRDIEDESK